MGQSLSFTLEQVLAAAGVGADEEAVRQALASGASLREALCLTGGAQQNVATDQTRKRKQRGELPCLTYSVEEFAELAGLSRAKAYDAVAKCEIECVRFGKSIRIPKAAVMKYLGPLPE
jgi:excisionase family DNA binding protein